MGNTGPRWEEVLLQFKVLIRQIHRWVSIIFTLTVIVSFIASAQEEPVEWIFYLPLLPLAVLLFTGLYLFVLPYVAKRRSRRRADR